MSQAHINQSQSHNLKLEDASVFSSLLDKEFKPKGDEQREAVETAVRTLAAQALENTMVISDDAYSSINAIIGEIDRKLSEQINLILHHENFQKLESAWRGLHYLVSNTETNDKLKIRFMDISKDELRRTLRRFKGTSWDQSPIFKRLYEEEYGQLGGEPYSCIVTDYHFDHSAPDVEMLTGLSKVAAAAHTPLLAGAAPSILQMDSWQEIANPRDLTKITNNKEHMVWNALRDSEDSRYIGLAMPRFLGRMPYGAKTNPVDTFNFEETVDGANHRQFIWVNAAYAMATNVTRSFNTWGWATSIRGVENGGTVENLPCYTFPTDDGGFDIKCPTEVAISDRREAELSKIGLMPLIHRKGTAYATFIGAQSFQRAQVYDNPDATANAVLATRLPYMFATSRFAHYLKSIVRDKIGSFRTPEEVSRWLNNWIINYVDGDPANSSNEAKARRPLAEAEVQVEARDGEPGYYYAKIHLKPHFQLEGLKLSLSLTTKMPSAKGQ